MFLHWPALTSENKYNDNIVYFYPITIEHTPKYHLIIYNYTFMNIYYYKFFLYNFHMVQHLISMCIYLPALIWAQKNQYNTMHLCVITVELTYKENLLIYNFPLMTLYYDYNLSNHFRIDFHFLDMCLHMQKFSKTIALSFYSQ